MGSPELRSAEADLNPNLVVTTHGEVDAGEAHRAIRTIGRVLRCHHIGEVAHVRLAATRNGEPALAQVNVPVGGEPCRAQVQGPRGFVASFVAARLDQQIARLAGDEPGRPWPDPARPALAFAGEPRPVSRRKQCALLTGTPDAAVRVLDAMDYDAHLFTDAETGEDAVVFRAGPLGVRLARQHSPRPPRTAPATPLTMHPHPTPRLTEEEAAARLCRYGLPFLFCTDPSDGRGRLLYRRYDGDLTILSPVGGDVRLRPAHQGDDAS